MLSSRTAIVCPFVKNSCSLTVYNLMVNFGLYPHILSVCNSKGVSRGSAPPREARGFGRHRRTQYLRGIRHGKYKRPSGSAVFNPSSPNMCNDCGAMALRRDCGPKRCEQIARTHALAACADPQSPRRRHALSRHPPSIPESDHHLRPVLHGP